MSYFPRPRGRGGYHPPRQQQQHFQQQQFAEQPQSTGPTFSGYKPKAKQERDKARSNEFREKKGRETMEDIKKELDKTLFFGFSMEAKSLEAQRIVVVPQAKVLPISTRVVGFSTQAMFTKINQVMRNPPECNVYEAYRVSLAQLEYKMIESNRDMTMNDNQDPANYIVNSMALDIREALLACPINFNVTASAINAVGSFEYNQQKYYTKIPSLPVPNPVAVTFSNLRATVMALANDRTPRNLRVYFYNNNPLPGARWRGIRPVGRRPHDFEINPVLENPNDFWPDNYEIHDFRDDINRFMSLMNWTCRKSLKYVNIESKIDYRGPGQKTCLVSNYVQDNLRNSEPHYIDDRIDWANTGLPIGNLEEFWSSVPLEDLPMFIGMLQLLGEVPIDRSGNPTYRVRSKENSATGINRAWVNVFMNMMG